MNLKFLAAATVSVLFWLNFGEKTNAQTRDLGVDVSHYQGATGVSQTAWNQMTSEGKRFAYIKATEGLTGPDDAAMSNNLVRAAAAGLLVGAYHYPHAENRPTTNGAVLEADHFLGYAGTAIGPGRLRPVLDLEGSSATLSKTALTDWVIAFCDRIVEQRGRSAMPIIYSNRSFANSELDSRMAGYDLWLAYYTNVDVQISAPPPTTSYPNPTGVFTNWCFWQYSSTGSSGGISPLDLDVCHSEYKSLASFLIPYPVVLSSATVTAEGTMQFGFTNVPGFSFQVQVKTNLTSTNWVTLGTAAESISGTYQFSETGLGSVQQRFYRVIAP